MNHILKISILVLFLFLIILYIQFGFNYKLYSDFEDRFLPCIEEMKEHSLYNQQANCYHPPFLFLTALILKELFNNYFPISIILTTLLLNLLSLLIIIKIIQKETNKLFLFLPIVLYILLIFIHITNYFVISLGMFLLLIGFYILFYSNLRYKEPLTGLFFILAILSKQTALIPITVILTFYSIKTLNIHFANRRLNIDFKKLPKLFPIALPIFLIILFLILIYPNFLQYTFFIVNIKETAFTTHNITLTFTTLFLFIALLLSFYLFIKKRDIFSTTVFFSYLISSYFDLSIGDLDIEYYKLIFVIPSFIIMLIVWKNNIKQNQFKKTILILIIILLIYPNLKILYLNHEFNDFQQEYNYILNYIPDQDYTLLDNTYFLKYANFKYKGADSLIKITTYDHIAAPRLEEMGLVNISEWQQKREDKYYKPILNNLLNNKYGLLIISPPYDFSDMYQLIIKYPGISDPFCKVELPFIKSNSLTDPSGVDIYFSNLSHCNYLKEKIQIYYNEHFESICKKSKIATNMYISHFFIDNNLKLNKECYSEEDLLLKYSNSQLITNKDIKLILLILLLTILVLFYDILKIKKSFLLTFFLITIFLIIIIFIKSENEDLRYNQLYIDYMKIHPKECLYQSNLSSSWLIMGRACFLTKDCFEAAKEMNINTSFFKCINTYYNRLPLSLRCNTKEDCLKQLNPNLAQNIKLNQSIFCFDSFCTMLDYTMQISPFQQIDAFKECLYKNPETKELKYVGTFCATEQDCVDGIFLYYNFKPNLSEVKCVESFYTKISNNLKCESRKDCLVNIYINFPIDIALIRCTDNLCEASNRLLNATKFENLS